jgi:hypothetical protein
MARKKTKGTKKAGRGAKRGTVKSRKKTRTAGAKGSARKAAESTSVGSKALDLLRAWAPSRYSKR